MRYTQDQIDRIVANLERAITDPETSDLNLAEAKADLTTEDVAEARNALEKVFRDYGYAAEEITKLKSQDDYIDKLNVLCEDFGCEGGSDRLAWLHDELSKISRLQSRIEELERVLKPFADGLTYLDQMGSMRKEYLASISCTGKFGEAELIRARSALEASHKGGK